MLPRLLAMATANMVNNFRRLTPSFFSYSISIAAYGLHNNSFLWGLAIVVRKGFVMPFLHYCGFPKIDHPHAILLAIAACIWQLQYFDALLVQDQCLGPSCFRVLLDSLPIVSYRIIISMDSFNSRVNGYCWSIG